MSEDRRGTTPGGDPQLTVIVTGTHDVYRFAHHLQHGQCEFADVGHRTQSYLVRKLGKPNFGWLVDYMHGRGYR